jgi:O-acetyl-ADP-ribose deacetylase
LYFKPSGKLEEGLQMSRITVVHGDITKQTVDVIVNAANSSLLGGGGVDGAIHRAGGPSILAACLAIRQKKGDCPCPPGEAVITTAGNLPAKYVIHTVGPIWNGGNQGEPELLKSCYRKSLQLAVKNGARSIAFPNISTGVFRYPKDRAAAIAIHEIRTFLSINHIPEEVRFVCFEAEQAGLYRPLIKGEYW